MFDSHTHKTESNVVAVTKVVEKTITPDKVTDMYKQVEEEVKKMIVRSITIHDNNLRGTAVEFRKKHDTLTNIVYTRIILNGEESLWSQEYPAHQLTNDSVLVDILKKHYIEMVSNKLVMIAAPNIHNS